jgi:hypothetical protein
LPLVRVFFGISSIPIMISLLFTESSEFYNITYSKNFIT